MNRLLPASAVGLLGISLIAARPARAAAREDLARQAEQLFKARCLDCHGGAHDVGSRFNIVRDLAPPFASDDPPLVVAGHPEESAVYRLAEEDEMPALGEPLTPEEKQLIFDWIQSLPPQAGTGRQPSRRPVTDADALAAMRSFLAKRPPVDRPRWRFFTLANLHNNARVSDADLKLNRAALSKMINSLHWMEQIVIPEAADDSQTLYAVDLRALGWERPDKWRDLLAVYPYGLFFEGSPDPRLSGLAAEIRAMTGTDLPFIRADWFVANAGRPPLYYSMLDLPEEVIQLERNFGIDSIENLKKDRSRRAGFERSRVSSQNRVVERHVPKKLGSTTFWMSYDFLKNDGRGNIFEFPLGPLFDGSEFSDQAFIHAGGEMIFALPNGLHGYFLSNAKGKRIDEGPTAIVSDKLKTSGSPAIVSGISCMACHTKGIIPFEDKIGPAAAHLPVPDPAKAKIERLHIPKERMKFLVQKDQERYMKAFTNATKPFLQGSGAVAEPVAALVRRYLADSGADQLAVEIGLKDGKELREMIPRQRALQYQGLGALAQPYGAVKRTLLESLKNPISPFQEAAAAVLKTPAVAGGVPAFRPNDTVEFKIPTDFRTGSEIESRWISPSGSVRSIKSTPLVSNAGEAMVRYYLSPAEDRPWPAGRYRLEIIVDGRKQAARVFSIVP